MTGIIFKTGIQRKTIISAILLCLFLSFNSVYADTIEEGYHFVRQCKKIVNLQDFPDIVLIALVDGPLPPNEPVYLIKPNSCLSRGYKLNSIKIYAAEKSYIDSRGLRNLNIVRLKEPGIAHTIDDENLLSASEYMEGPTPSVVPDTDPLIETNIELSIAGFLGDRVILYESKRILKYRNGNPVTLTYEKPELKNLRTKFKE